MVETHRARDGLTVVIKVLDRIASKILGEHTKEGFCPCHEGEDIGIGFR